MPIREGGAPQNYNVGGIRMQALGGPYAGQTFTGGNLPGDWFTQTMGGGTGAAAGGGAALPPAIAPPSVSEFGFSQESQAYPTYMRNLGEQQAQRQFQSNVNNIGMGNSSQNYMHAQDMLNAARLGYMGQAGQEELGVQNSMAAARAAYNNTLAGLYGSQVNQRGQDVGYMGQLANASAKASSGSGGGGMMSLGGSHYDKYNPRPVGSFRGMEDEVHNNMIGQVADGGWF